MIDLKTEKTIFEKMVCGFVFISLALSSVYVTVMIFISPAIPELQAPGARTKSDYILMLVQCVLGLFAMLLPGLLEHRINLVIPSRMLIFYALFLYCAIYLGEVRNYYFVVPYWDIILHTCSSAMLSTLGYSFIILLNRTESIPPDFRPLVIASFTFCFAVTLGVFWEFYEYLFDGLLGLNMQKFALPDGTLLSGREALEDTMEDLMVNSLSAFVISAAGYLSLKHRKGWIERIILRIRK